MADSKSDAAGLSGLSGRDGKTPKPDKKRPNIVVSPCSPSLDDGESKAPDPMIVIMEELRLVREEMREIREEVGESRQEMREIREEISESRSFRIHVTDELKNMKSQIKESMTEVTNKMKKESVTFTSQKSTHIYAIYYY